MTPVRRLVLALIACVSVAAAGAAVAAPGYLDAARLPDASAFIVPPPAPDSPEGRADAQAFRLTRALQGSLRWTLAAHDDIYDAPVVLADFDCALGTRVDAADTPRLLALIGKAQGDASATVRRAKTLYRRPRPIEGNQAPFCVDRKGYGGTFSYPSGHATMISLVSLILAELAPDRAGAIAARGRAYAESRVVCGAHWPSDIAAGRDAGAVVFATLHADPAFRADMQAARAELDAARARPATPEGMQCRIEDAAAARRPW